MIANDKYRGLESYYFLYYIPFMMIILFLVDSTHNNTTWLKVLTQACFLSLLKLGLSIILGEAILPILELERPTSKK